MKDQIFHLKFVNHCVHHSQHYSLLNTIYKNFPFIPYSSLVTSYIELEHVRHIPFLPISSIETQVPQLRLSNPTRPYSIRSNPSPEHLSSPSNSLPRPPVFLVLLKLLSVPPMTCPDKCLSPRTLDSSIHSSRPLR